MRPVRRLAVIAALSAVTLVGAGAAQASIAELKDSEVSCDAATIKTVGTIWPLVASTIGITQRHDTTESSTSIVWLRSPVGNETGKGRVSNGTAVGWQGIPAGTWSVRALRSTAKNCNGALPGNGNYHLYLTVTHS